MGAEVVVAGRFRTHAGRDRDMGVETDAPAGDVTPWELGYLDDGDDALGAPEPARLPTPSSSRTAREAPRP
jgi:hypothetical protein